MAVGLTLPAVAQATSDLSIDQAPSARTVKPGGEVTFNITVANVGDTQPPYSGDVFVEVSSQLIDGKPANNPYTSFSSTRGSCADKSAVAYGGFTYYVLLCSLGSLAPGESATITASARLNQSMNHYAKLLPSPSTGGYEDDNNLNNESDTTIYLDKAPVVAGSKALKLAGLPEGCVTGDFTLKVSVHASHVKKVVVSLYYDIRGDFQHFKKTGRGNRLRATIPASKILPELDKVYELKVKARRAGSKPLKATVDFVRC